MKVYILRSIPLTIKNRKEKAMIECGTAVCFIPELIARKLQLKVDFEDVMEIQGYGEEKLKTIGTTKEDIFIDQFRIEWKFHVLPQSVNQLDVIIGLDFLKRFNTEIDFQENILKFECNKGSIFIKLEDKSGEVEKSEYTNLPAYAMEDMVLKSGEVSFVKVNTGDLEMGKDDYLFEGVEEKADFLCGTISEKKRTVAVRNETGRVMKIQKGEKWGWFLSWWKTRKKF